MHRSLGVSGKCVLVCGLVLAVLVPLDSARAFEVLYAFTGGSDGTGPHGSLLMDSTGNLYGTTVYGGAMNAGTAFRLAKDGSETVLYFFMGGADGAYPYANLINDSAANLYGTTGSGGANNDGTVFKLASDGTETVLHSFMAGSDGSVPHGGLIADNAGNLYGTTYQGGSSSICSSGSTGCGIVFKLSPSGTETVLYAFAGGSDGANPYAGLIEDSAGNLYGTTAQGGRGSCDGTPGCGTVFKLTADGSETVLYTFTGGSDGGFPLAGVIEDSAGNLYGTTEQGGAHKTGTVFKLATDGTETVLYSFPGDGGLPYGGVITDSAGNLYGTTQQGGAHEAGTVFKLATGGTETVLHSFKERRDGTDPTASLITDKEGRLYGTAFGGGAKAYGTVFKLKK